MICSLRFYFKHASEHFDARTALEVLDHLSQALSFHDSHYKCTVYFDDDSSEGDVYAFPAGEKGKSKLLNAIEDLLVRKHHEKPICIFLAGISKGQKNEAFSPRCEFVLTTEKMTSHLCIDVPYDCLNPNMHRELYVQIIEYLSSHGLTVNNSFCHTVSNWRQTHAFDSIHVAAGPIGFKSPLTRSILKHAVRHSSKYRLNCFANIYWGNSISSSELKPGAVQSITQILGTDCVRETAQSLIFVLSEFPRPSPVFIFRLLRIRRLLKDHIA